MAMTPGLSPNIRMPEEGLMNGATPDSGAEIIIEDADEGADVPELDMDGNVLTIEHPDGSISVSLDGQPIERASKTSAGWFDNLVNDIEPSELTRIADDLMRGISDDIESRKEWIEDRAQGLKLLGLKLEVPGIGGAADGAPVEGMSKVRHPLLLEACLRFQANARSELLPTDGPVKIRNDDNNSTPQEDNLANFLERDLNHYLTAVATEYYPDTDRMLLMLGFGGTAFKKVYYCPLRNRPVSETVDADDLIVNNAATDLRNAKRVTHRTFMRPSTIKRLQLLGVYRDTDLNTPSPANLDAVKREEKSLQGISVSVANPDDRDREIYECYCELDIAGFEHEYKGKVTGLEIPYRVTIDASSREILSIVRNYDEDCVGLPEARENFVKYTFVPGLGFYDIGLLHILGNTTNAITAAWREMLDAGMYANFPGFLMADTGARQNTNIFRVPPGGGALVKTGGMPINQAVMPLPYKEPGGALMSLVDNMAQTGMRIGGTSEQQVGEGRADAAVGTTLAMIDQAMKVMNAVHKRMHSAQAREFELIVRTFKENPDSFWERCKKPSYQWDEQTFLTAIEDCDLVPQADPNTASHSQRLMKIVGLKQLQQSNPRMYNQVAIDTAALQAMGWNNPEQFFAPEQQRNAPPPEMMAAMADMQIRKQDADTRSKEADGKLAIDQAKLQADQQIDMARLGELYIKKQEADTKQQSAQARMMYDQTRAENEIAKIRADQVAEQRIDPTDQMLAQMKLKEMEIRQADAEFDALNRDAERESRERVALAKIVQDLAAHPEAAPLVEKYLTPEFLQNLKEEG